VGPANLSFLIARIMIERGGGRVVNISSRGAFRGESETPAYGASKAGLNAMSQSSSCAGEACPRRGGCGT
jgi:3-oxoacyl-[acyl-carrier protein] reductase